MEERKTIAVDSGGKKIWIQQPRIYKINNEILGTNEHINYEQVRTGRQLLYLLSFSFLSLGQENKYSHVLKL